MPRNGVDLNEADIFFGCPDKKKNDPVIKNEFSLKLSVQNGIFLISIIIRDLKTGSVIVDIKENRVNINKVGTNDYSDNISSTPQRLEILDQYNYPALSMWVDDKQHLNIRGYFVGNLCTYFLYDEEIRFIARDSPTYHQTILENASKLKRVFIKK